MCGTNACHEDVDSNQMRLLTTPEHQHIADPLTNLVLRTRKLHG
jgi:hypothetical protein